MTNRLQPLAANLWVAEGPLVNFYSFPYPTRMVVARMSGGGLWIWSPIPLDPQLTDELAILGSPAHLVSPNKIHHLFLPEWNRTFPDARLWGLPPVLRKHRELKFAAVLGDSPPPDWRTEIDQVIFHGSLFMDEVVFFHRPSRTVVFADLIENFSREFLRNTPGWNGWKRAVARAWRITEPAGMAPLEWRLSFVRRRRARAALSKTLAWDPVGVVIAHGTCVTRGGRAFIEQSFRWLTAPAPRAVPAAAH
jgi:Domain of unknown function (DUF4336)